MTFLPGTEVVRVSCPDSCASDCDFIPAGSFGVLQDVAPEINDPDDDDGSGEPELVYHILWTRPNGTVVEWWSMEHAFMEAGLQFTDKTWME